MSGKVICLIPARGGSKGVPGKNIRELNGIPLVAHSISQAEAASLVDDVYVTSDDLQILQVAKNYNANIIHRPAEISGDTASSESALLHALHVIEDTGENVSLIVFLQCTSPIRSPVDIDNAIRVLQQSQADSLLSVVNSHRFFWKEVNGNAVSVNYDYRERPRRQDMAPQYQENGSIYIFTPEVLKQYNNRLGGKIALYEMGESSNIDIDTENDLLLAQAMLTKLSEDGEVNDH